jgi:hypothetical protein
VQKVTSYPAFPIRPYQSLLVINPSALPADASPDLLKFASVCKPSKSFQDLQMELNVPLSQIFRMSAHLLYWRVGKVVLLLPHSSLGDFLFFRLDCFDFGNNKCVLCSSVVDGVGFVDFGLCGRIP